MSITVTLTQGGRELSRTAKPQTMDDVMAYLRAWVSPLPVRGEVHAKVEVPHREPQHYQLRVNCKHVTLIPQR